MKVKVEITETLRKVVEVDAESVAEGVAMVAFDYGCGKIVIDERNFSGFSIKECRERERD